MAARRKPPDHREVFRYLVRLQDQTTGLLPVLETLTRTAHCFRLPVNEVRRIVDAGVAGDWLEDPELQLAAHGLEDRR